MSIQFHVGSEVPIEALLIQLLVWIGAHTAYTVDGPLPAFEVLPQAELQALYVEHLADPSKAAAASLKARALYVPAKQIIYISAELRPETSVLDRETVLHELIHHVQYSNNAQTRWPCEQAAEKEAYLLGVEYLKDSGFTDSFVLDSYRRYAFFLSQCPRDVHPGRREK